MCIRDSCYIVSEPGIYTLNPVKGNGEEILTNAASATILWETYGTDVAPNKGDLIVGICYKDNKVVFKTADNFKNGNAAVAVTDTEGHILWSWHIWMLDEKISEHTYANDAGVMMDRNLGATSAATGNIGSLGLYYQWGRKDPFVGYSVIDDCIDAKSSVNFPAHIKSSVETGTIEYAVSHPMTFIYGTGDFNSDWFYTGDNTVDNTRWSTSKTIYDPCPAGWKVPDGGQNGVWAKAFGDRVIEDITFDEINRGITVPSEYCSSQPWYPAAGRIFYRGSSYWYEDYVGLKGRYWTNTIDPTNQGLAFAFTFSTTERAFAYSGYTRHTAHTIRCQKIK